MQPPGGYRLQKCLRSTPRCEIHQALRERDGREVVLKSYRGDRSSEPGGRAAREFEALRAIAPGFAVLPLDLDRSMPSTVLVLEPFAGEPLRGQLDPRVFLDFAVRAARALAAVHTARIVHRALAPDSFLVEPATGALRLAGFGHAAPLGAPIEPELYAIDAPLRYLAPETSGRTGRGMDGRSDLYALGAIFYELLTGLAPFEAADPQELMSAHLARRPRSPLDLRPELPATLARIALRLLEKEPEDRYQTAEALAVDLETCREQLARTGRIDDDLPLGSADAPYRPLFRRVLYGREHEVETLLESYRRAAAGRRQLLVVRGAPGIGKSALVPELHRPLALEGGYLAQGKFDLYRRHLPYAAFAAAFGSLAEQIASESGVRRQEWGYRLVQALGALAGVITEWVPALAALLGPQPAVPMLGPRETQQRLGVAVGRLLHAAALHARPLVLFLDDLQWADAGSLYLLEELLHSDSSDPLLVLCAYRDGEVDGSHAFSGWLARAARADPPLRALELGPLSESAATRMLADALGREGEPARALAAAVARTSGNNPLLIQQCVHHLHQLGAIRHERGRGWLWDEASVAAANLPEDALGMMIAKLGRLPAAARNVLTLASCAGDCFDVELLLELRSQERSSLESALYALSDEGLIAPAHAGFRFVHDRIREAAQAQLGDGERAALHCDAARLLIGRRDPAALSARAFEIADHLILGRSRLAEAERARAMEIHAAAGALALAAGAAATAGRYFEAGLELFREADWSERAKLGFALHLQAAESAHQMRDAARAIALLDALAARPLSRLESAQLDAHRIRVAVFAGGDALGLTLAALRRLGVRWPLHPSWLRVRWAIRRADRLLQRSFGSGAPLDGSPGDPAALAPILVLAAGGAALQLRDLRLALLAAAHVLQHYAEHGIPPQRSPSLALASYAGYRLALLDDVPRAALQSQTAQAWLARAPSPQTDARAEFGLQFFLRSWFAPRRDVAEALLRVSQAAREGGDLEFSDYAASAHFRYLALSGETIPACLARLAALGEQGNRGDPNFAEACRRPYALLQAAGARIDWARELQPGTPIAVILRGFPEIPAHWALALCVCGEFARAAELCSGAWSRAYRDAPPGSYRADLVLLQGLSHGALARGARGLVRLRSALLVRRCARKLRRWHQPGDDLGPMLRLLEAESARLEGRSQLALESYAAARALAQSQQYRHLAALAEERRSELLAELGQAAEASAALHHAIALYEDWGAQLKAESLRSRLAAGLQPEPRS